MDYDTCFETLGVESGASLRQIHSAYKQLALKHHPDRAPDDPESHEVFIRVTEAYSILKNAYFTAKGVPQRARMKKCHRCGTYGTLLDGLDRKQYCPDCLLGRRRKLLPMPLMETIRCIGVFVLLATAVGLIVRASIVGPRGLFLVAGALCIAGLGLLAYHVWSADVIKK